MGRPVKLRVSYNAELRHVLRLKEAVEMDQRDKRWSKKVVALLAQLATEFMAGPHIPANSDGQIEKR